MTDDHIITSGLEEGRASPIADPPKEASSSESTEHRNANLSDLSASGEDNDINAGDDDWIAAIPGRFSGVQYISRTCCSTKFAAQTPCCKAVCSARDNRTGRAVTLERLQQPFSNVESATRLYSEITLLLAMKHENVVGLVDCFGNALTDSLDGDESLNGRSDLYLHVVSSRSPHGCTLQTVMRTEPLSDEHVCFITYQILRGLKYLHSAQIVHGDLKPGNIIVEEDSQVMIADLGIRQHLSPSTVSTPMFTKSTSFPQTVFHDFGTQLSRSQLPRSESLSSDSGPPRTPLEFSNVFSNMELKTAADVWAVGCIMAEMITCRPLFHGTDNIQQLVEILLLTNHSPKDVLERLPDDEAIRQHARGILYMNPRKRPFKDVFAGAGENAVNLLQQMLAINIAERISVPSALQHAYLVDFHDPDDEPTTSEFMTDKHAAICSTFQTPSDVQLAIRTSLQLWRDQKSKRLRSDAAGPCLESPPLKRNQESLTANLSVVLSA